jgi:hypothetical protein
LFLSFTLFTFVGSIGVGVYSHFCSKDGLEQSFFVRQAHHCEEEKTVIAACCEHDAKKELKSDCCSDQVQIVQIDLDYFQQISNFLFLPFNAPTPVYEVLPGKIKTEEIAKCLLANPPPLPSGRDIIIKNQVFLI